MPDAVSEKLPAGASEEQIREALKPTCPFGKGKWADLSGLIVPHDALIGLLEQVERGELSLEGLFDAFHRLHEQYYDAEWTWAYDKFQEFFGYPLESVTVPQVIEMVQRWKEAVIGLDRELYEDARKEFNLASMTSFGADGDKLVKERDFTQVRGEFESNSFVTAVLDHIRQKEALGNELIARLESK